MPDLVTLLAGASSGLGGAGGPAALAGVPYVPAALEGGLVGAAASAAAAAAAQAAQDDFADVLGSLRRGFARVRGCGREGEGCVRVQSEATMANKARRRMGWGAGAAGRA